MFHSADKFRRGTFLCCVSELLRLRKTLSIRRGSFKRFHRFFLSHSAEELRRGESFSFSLILVIDKVWITRGEIIKIFAKFFCHRVPKNFVVEPFCAVSQKYSGSEKVNGQEVVVEYQDIPSITFCLIVPKKFVWEPFCVSLFPRIEEVYVKEVEESIKNLRRNISVSQCRETS